MVLIVPQETLKKGGTYMAGFGGSVKLTGESEYRKALKDITSNLKLVSSELKLTNTEFNNGDKTIKQTKSSYDNMGKTLQDQKAKVSALKETLAQAEKEYGSNNEKVKMFKTQLNNAENQLKQMENATDKSTKELKEMKEGFDDAGKGASTFGDVLKANVLGDIITGGLKKLGSAVLEVGKAFLKVGKQAIEGYAEFEQLEGGVKKLFGDEMAETVKKNANDAFKTAGMTANEYMETVTSFSASLIGSLGGDTKKATDYADMAIKDMSDNANTFGTDISSIQNAYQGFAKGNFGMLDNLKLGYGGTKAEMERLLSDAEKMPEAMGQKFDLNNYSDVVKAINLTQQRMNIAGTTSKEASMTIGGSLSATKSAWSNLVTGLADDSADFGQLVGNLMESLLGKGGEGGLINNILPRIETVMNSIVTMIPTLLETLLPKLLEIGTNLLVTLLTGITNALPQILPTIVQALMTVVQAVIDNLPMILQAGITILIELVKGITQSLPELIPAIVDAVMLMVETLIDNIDLIIDAGIELILALAEGLIEALPRLIEKIPVIIEKLLMAISNNLPKIVEMGITLIIQLAVGLVKAIPQLVSKVPQIISSFINAITNYYSKLGEIGKNLLNKVKDGIVSGISKIGEVGKNLVQGLWNGINNAKDWVLNKIKGFGSSILNGIKSFFGIHSPSKVFEEQIGTNLALGIGQGFENTMGDVTKEMTSAIPTEFDTNATINGIISNNPKSSNSYTDMLNAFKEALKDVKVVMDDREMGTFVTDTMEKVIYT
jgi:phage-related protein